MSDDAELKRLMSKRLAEMQQHAKEHKTVDNHDEPSPRDVVVSMLGYRGLEVLETAEKQFPSQASVIVSGLAKIISSGRLTEKVDGGDLARVFAISGFPLRLNTRISVVKDGKAVSLADKISGRKP
ncbi:MAG: double-stranded DNA-binding protein [Cenarchaeum sp. SB0665_bin_23]|nr:double-stranded DNA-binding protein [Cenarchaeum sp. SB0667_bin_13]MXY61350.1 double-stranded DNA-binding protein [Cenarchaeum sp. SB0665_bin_23]MYB46533.1 double-stranded DNA-binding protein [Cenarchaeum sp. SB0662_bin_33]MYC79736.1 double-stranded DNA-binding protein [Cenarchaeum sp. SB0661_bin_35]MYD58201.1 double-stranded DNA-binding protein [Cenarchaeum sp. SB0678_bin_8]MYG33297.1 double-stranded DNA-binding protein [Cenarchaeum sp. SB0677_bin_16]MYI52011.1 double-stranded DNA-binding